VRKSLIIFIFLSYLFSYTECKELLKLPLLIEHFIAHNSIDNSISFTDFLSMHYLQDQDNDGDDEHDRSLPFKSHNNCYSSNAFAFNTHTTIATIKPIEININKEFLPHQEFLPTCYQASIWQPPKI